MTSYINDRGKTPTVGTVTSVAQTFTGGLISVAGSPITTTGTLALTVAGTSGGIPYFSSGTVWASSAALTANAIVIGGGAGAAPSTTTTGTGILTFLGTPSSANLASAITDETGSGPLVFATKPSFTSTIGVGAATASASGSGISFPATQDASTDANTLDDYEEGTWTPSFTFGTVGDLSVAYTTQKGTYTKVGRKITAACTIITSSFTHTTASGGAIVTGLPYAALTFSGHAWSGPLRWGGITKANYTQWNSRIGSGAQQVTFDGFGSGQAAVNLLAGDMPTGGSVELIFTITYET